MNRSFLKFALAIVAWYGCLAENVQARSAFTLQQGDYYTSSWDSTAISQFSTAGVLKGTLTLPGTYGRSVRGMQFFDDSLYAVTENGDGFNLVRIDSDLGISVLYRAVPTYIRGNLSFGKLAVSENSLFVAGQDVLLRFDFGASAPTQIFTENQIFDVKILPWGNLLVATAYTIQEITTSGAVVRQIRPVGVYLTDVRGVEYDNATRSLYVTQLSTPSMMRINYDTGVVEKSANRSYANDLFFTSDGNLLVGSWTRTAALFDADLNLLHEMGRVDQMFVTEYPPTLAPTPIPTSTPGPNSTPPPSTPRPDRKPPQLEVYGGLKRMSAQHELLIGGRVTDNVAVAILEVKAQGGRFQEVPEKGYWTTTINLKVGKNVILIRATDTAGNRTTVRLTATRFF